MKYTESFLWQYGWILLMPGLLLLVIAIWPSRLPAPADPPAASVGYYLGEALRPYVFAIGGVLSLIGMLLLGIARWVHSRI